MNSGIPFYRQKIFEDYLDELTRFSKREISFDKSSLSYLNSLINKVLSLVDLHDYTSAVMSIKRFCDKVEELNFIENPNFKNSAELDQIIRDQIKGFNTLMNGDHYEFKTETYSIENYSDLEQNLDGTFRDLDLCSVEFEQMKSFMSECRVVLNNWDALIDLVSVGSVNLEVFQQLYRSIHNLKGVASFYLEFASIFVKICHETESFFQEIIDGRIKSLSQNQIDCIIRIYNVLKILSNNLDRFIQGREPFYENLDLRRTLLSIHLMSVKEEVFPEHILPARLNSLGIGETVRISAIQLDDLMERIQKTKLGTTELISKYQEFSSIVKDLQFLENSIFQVQDHIQEMRLFPIGLLFESFSKQVYDLQKQLNKNVNFEFRGAQTKVDRTIADSVLTPLIHLVRNAMDHGIETSAERIKLGKSIEGKIIISATCRKNKILFDVIDDGRGVDEDAIREIANQRGLDSSFSLKDILCSPGFTSKTSMSAISGRGAGMDAVLSEVERIGGHLSVESILNKGCTVRLTLPLDFYSDDFLIIQSNQLNYLLPVQNVLKIFDIEEEFSHANISSLISENHRDQIPQISLNKVLEHPADSNTVSLLLESHNEDFFVLNISKLLRKQRLMVKPFRSPFLKRNRLVSRAAKLSDGMLACVLDIDTLFEHAKCY